MSQTVVVAHAVGRPASSARMCICYDNVSCTQKSIDWKTYGVSASQCFWTVLLRCHGGPVREVSTSQQQQKLVRVLILRR